MTEAKDSFSVSLRVHGFLLPVSDLTKALEIEPSVSITKGQDMGVFHAHRSSWFAPFREGIGNVEFGHALEDFLKWLEQHSSTIDPILSHGGEVVVVLRQRVAVNGGLIFSLKLEPFFLHMCGMRGVTLEIEAWNSTEEQAHDQDNQPEIQRTTNDQHDVKESSK